MAPVTGGVADGEEYRPVGLFCLFERLIPPCIPIYRVVGVLEKIWALLVNEAVCIFMFLVGEHRFFSYAD